MTNWKQALAIAIFVWPSLVANPAEAQKKATKPPKQFWYGDPPKLGTKMDWFRYCDQAALTTLTAEELSAIDKLKAVGFRILPFGSYPPVVVTDGNKIVLRDNPLPRGVFLEYHWTSPASKSRLTSRDMEPLADLQHVERLALRRTLATDDTPVFLARMIDLRKLDLAFTQITDAGIKLLGHHKKLEFLELQGTRVTNEGVLAIAALPALKEVRLAHTAVSDAGMPALAASRTLERVELNNTGIGDGGVLALGRAPKLLSLRLMRSNVSDKGLAEMARGGAFPKLRTLDLSFTKISDDGLKSLHDPAALPSLKILIIDSTKTTTAGRAALIQARTGLQIQW